MVFRDGLGRIDVGDQAAEGAEGFFPQGVDMPLAILLIRTQWPPFQGFSTQSAASQGQGGQSI